MVCLPEDMITRFDRRYECDGRTDTAWQHRLHMPSITWQKCCP